MLDLVLARPQVAVLLHPSCCVRSLLFQRRKDAIESFENASVSTSADQPKPKRRRKSKKLSPSSVPLSTHEEPEEVVEAMDISCAVEASEGVSSCPPVSDFGRVSLCVESLFTKDDRIFLCWNVLQV